MSTPSDGIQFRPMVGGDVGRYPIGCQGDASEVTARIRDLGASAILAFDGTKHVGQLQFRRYDRELRSPSGPSDTAFWGDFGASAPDLGLNALSVFCFHVGQTEDSAERDESYFGRGIGLGLLDYLLGWAEQQGYNAVAAKATPSARSVMTFMGGLPVASYRDRGFEVTSSWIDSQVRDLVSERGVIVEAASPQETSEVSCCVRRFPGDR